MASPGKKNQAMQIDEMAVAFKALSNSNRLQILLHLMNCCSPGMTCSPQEVEDLCVGEIGESLTISPSTLSHHLKELQQAGFLVMTRQGQKIRCSLNEDKLFQLENFFSQKSL
jgi:ArsR family transcriptional regulator